MVTLVVPGVRVETRFDVLPPLPAPSGIVGVVGVVDWPADAPGLIAVSRVSELRSLLGPGTEVSCADAVNALRNGASEVVISAVAGGTPASCTLKNADGVDCLRLVCRSNGASGNDLRIESRQTTDSGGIPVRVSLQLLRGRDVLDSFANLRANPDAPDDLIETINSQSSYVVAVDPGFAAALPAADDYPFLATGAPISVKEQGGVREFMQLLPAADADPVGLSVNIALDGAKIRVRVSQAGLQEDLQNLSMDPDDDDYLPYALLKRSRLIRARPLYAVADAAKRLPAATSAPLSFTGGASPTVAQYNTAIDLLADDTRIDLVLACIEPSRSNAETSQIHSSLLAHAQTMSDAAAPRIAFGSITTSEATSADQIRDHAALVRGRRFVLVAPPGAAGSVAGAIGRLSPELSPTFKNVALHGIAPSLYRESELNRLLGAATNLLVVQNRIGHGVVVLRGIDTTGDQISVTRVADQCIRETKAIAENFIGELNSADARMALKQQLFATFLRMERAGWLVPSTDGSDPAFLVDVYSTQLDFAQGIVRVDIAVRPVRAIDYIYATIRVKN